MESNLILLDSIIKDSSVRNNFLSFFRSRGSFKCYFYKPYNFQCKVYIDINKLDYILDNYIKLINGYTLNVDYKKTKHYKGYIKLLNYYKKIKGVKNGK